MFELVLQTAPEQLGHIVVAMHVARAEKLIGEEAVLALGARHDERLCDQREDMGSAIEKCREQCEESQISQRSAKLSVRNESCCDMNARVQLHEKRDRQIDRRRERERDKIIPD